MIKTMLPVGSALFVKLAFSAAKKYPKECKTARINNIQIAFVPCIGGSFEKRFLPLEPVLGILFKVGLIAFFYAILELFLDAFRFSHDILLNAALWHR